MNSFVSLTLVSVLFVMPLAPVSLGAEQGADEPSQELKDLAQRVQALNAQIVTITPEGLRNPEGIGNYKIPGRIEALTAQIKELFTDYLLTELNRPDRPPAERLAKRLLFLQGKYALTDFDKSYAPFVREDSIVFPPLFLVAHLIWRGGDGAPDTKAILQAYAKEGSRYVLKGEGGGELDKHGLISVPVPAQRPGESWVLAHGVRFGASHRSRTVSLYSFNGSTLAKLWGKEDVPRGEVTLTPKGVTLTYENIGAYSHPEQSLDRLKTYRFTEEGLKLEKYEPECSKTAPDMCGEQQ